jgi:hypothetical protein
MFYAGDGHNHWHVKDLEGAQLTDASGNSVGSYTKTGFCFLDDDVYSASIPGRPSTPVYPGCATNQPNALSVKAGISVGWGDWYGYQMAFQWIDITGIPYGKYRLWAYADPHGFFRESSNTNNSTWTDISYGSSGVTATAYGPRARRQGPRAGRGRRCGYRATAKWSRGRGVLSHANSACWGTRIGRPQRIRLPDFRIPVALRNAPATRGLGRFASPVGWGSSLAVCHLRAAGAPDPRSAAPQPLDSV